MEEQDDRRRRRRWSADDKRAAVDLAFGEGGDVAAIAASLGVEPNRIHAWRRQLESTVSDVMGGDTLLFLPAVIADDAAPADTAPSSAVAPCGTIALRLKDVPITIGRDASPAVVIALISALRGGR